jgi:hypothetical protein
MDYEQEYQGYSRKKYSLMVFPRFQFKIIGLAFASSTGTVAIASWAFYYLIDRQFSRILEKVPMSPDAKTEMLSNLTLSFGYLFVLCGAFAVLMIGFSVFFSHRIAGPIYQINKVVDQFMEGQTEARIFLRKGDEFLFLGDKINYILGLAETAKNAGVSSANAVISKGQVSKTKIS